MLFQRNLLYCWVIYSQLERIYCQSIVPQRKQEVRHLHRTQFSVLFLEEFFSIIF